MSPVESLPSDARVETTVLVVADRAYLRHLRALAATICEAEPTWRFHFHLINLTSNEVAALSAEFPGATSSTTEREFRSEDEKRAVCANCRAHVMAELLEAGAARVIYFDADSLVRRPLGGLSERLDRHDLLLHHRLERQGEFEKFAAGVIAVRNSEGGRRFIADWRDRIAAREGEWYADQVGLFRAFEALRDQVDIGDLPREFIDWEFRARSPVWAGKGPRKYEARLYRLEEDRAIRRLEGRSSGALWFRHWLARGERALRRLVRRSS